MKLYQFTLICSAVLLLALSCVAQTTPSETKSKPNDKPLPVVLQIDEESIKDVLKPDGKPLLINFWATWCVPCVEEFPELVKLDNEFKGKIDFRTISLDDPIEKNRDVPKFLQEMNAEMPTYLLYSPVESDVIAMITDSWNGALPFSVLYAPDGKIAYMKLGIVKPVILRAEISKLLEVTQTSTKIEPCNPNDPNAVLNLQSNE